jgi:hypothetical protein
MLKIVKTIGLLLFIFNSFGQTDSSSSTFKWRYAVYNEFGKNIYSVLHLIPDTTGKSSDDRFLGMELGARFRLYNNIYLNTSYSAIKSRMYFTEKYAIRHTRGHALRLGLGNIWQLRKNNYFSLTYNISLSSTTNTYDYIIKNNYWNKDLVLKSVLNKKTKQLHHNLLIGIGKRFYDYEKHSVFFELLWVLNYSPPKSSTTSYPDYIVSYGRHSRIGLQTGIALIGGVFF